MCKEDIPIFGVDSISSLSSANCGEFERPVYVCGLMSDCDPLAEGEQSISRRIHCAGIGWSYEMSHRIEGGGQ